MKKLLLPFLLSSSVLAETSELYSNSNEIKEVLASNPYEPNYFSMLFGLFVVVGLIYLTGFIYQKLLKINPVSSSNQAIEVVTTKSLGQNKNLYVIKVNNEYSLIGTTQTSITFLKELNNFEINQDEVKKDALN